MIRAFTRVALLALFFTSSILAEALIIDELLKPAVKKEINKISDELANKTGIKIFVIATNDKLPANMVEYTKRYDTNITKPYVIFVFAPATKRVGVIASNNNIASLYDAGEVKEQSIGVVRDTGDGNSDEDKYNIAILQSVSELADQIAKSKNVKMTTTMPNETHYIVNALRVLIWSGALVVLWIFGGRILFYKIFKRLRVGK